MINEGYKIKNLKFRELGDVMNYLETKGISKAKTVASKKKLKAALLDLRKNQILYINEIPITRVK